MTPLPADRVRELRLVRTVRSRRAVPTYNERVIVAEHVADGTYVIGYVSPGRHRLVVLERADVDSLWSLKSEQIITIPEVASTPRGMSPLGIPMFHFTDRRNLGGWNPPTVC